MPRGVYPRKPRPPAPHGTNARYSSKCHCRACRDAHAAYSRNHRGTRLYSDPDPLPPTRWFEGSSNVPIDADTFRRVTRHIPCSGVWDDEPAWTLDPEVANVCELCGYVFGTSTQLAQHRCQPEPEPEPPPPRARPPRRQPEPSGVNIASTLDRIMGYGYTPPNLEEQFTELQAYVDRIVELLIVRLNAMDNAIANRRHDGKA